MPQQVITMISRFEENYKAKFESCGEAKNWSW